MKLISLQREMRFWLTREDAGAAARFGPDAGPGLSIYLNNYRSQLISCLEESFEQTRAWLGGQAFLSAAAIHIDRVSPSSWTLDAYARDFPATLGLLYPEDAEVAELALIDHALGEAFVGADADTVDPRSLETIDWDCATLHFVPTLHMLEVSTNAAAIWSALAEDEMPPAAETLPERAAILVWRHGQEPRFRTIEAGEAAALRSIDRALSFADFCAVLADTHGESEGVARAGSLLGQWLREGLVSAIGQGKA